MGHQCTCVHELPVSRTHVFMDSYGVVCVCMCVYVCTHSFPIIFHAVVGKDEREASSPSWFNQMEAKLVLQVRVCVCVRVCVHAHAHAGPCHMSSCNAYVCRAPSCLLPCTHAVHHGSPGHARQQTRSWGHRRHLTVQKAGAQAVYTHNPAYFKRGLAWSEHS